MGFEQYKYDISDFIGQDISSLSDTPSADGMSAADLKARFDNVPKMMIALGKLNGLIDYLIAGGYISKSDVELALTGMISSHEHPEKTTKLGVESALTGEILTHEHPEKTSKNGIEAVLTGMINTHEHAEKTTKQGVESVLTGEIDTHDHAEKTTKAKIESVLTGLISTHNHAENTTKQGIENALTGNITTHYHPEITTKTKVESVLNGVINTHSHIVTSNDVRFTDGQTFQQKYDSKELQGPRGFTGLPGPEGPPGVGIQGPPGPQGTPGIVVTTEINGAYQFSVESGNLYVSYAGDVPPAFTLEDGKLYLTV